MSTLRITASLLNLRQSPSTDAPVLLKLPEGFRVSRVGASADGAWLQVSADPGGGAVTGWISAQYAVPADEAPAAAPAAQAQGQGQGQGQALVITASLLNLRASPAGDAAVLAKLPQGTRVSRLGASADGAWLQVSGAAGTGWISAQYAAPAGAAPAAPVSAGDGKEGPWMTFARGEVGQKEVEGAQNNPRIVEYHKATSLKASDDETPWCSAFANWCMQQAGIRGTGLANARSWLDWGRKLDRPVPGCVVVLKRGTSATSGHVAFYVGDAGERIQCLGGNQGNSVKVSNYPRGDVLGYRLPA